jgi:hypothetical protein
VLCYGGCFCFYFNNWGGCPVASIAAPPLRARAAAWCLPPSSTTTPVFTDDQSVVVSSTPDLPTWVYRGEALPAAVRAPGVEFRPCVFVWNALTTRKFVTSSRRDLWLRCGSF